MPISEAVAGIIQGGIGALTQGATQRVQFQHEKDLNERSIQAQKDMAEYSYGKDLEQWERANAYNAPTSQMARLKEAGLNPAMIYGSGGAKTQAAISPKYQAPRPEYRYAAPIDPTSILEAYQSFRKNNAEVNLLRSQANIAKQEARFANVLQSNKAWKMSAQRNIADSIADYHTNNPKVSWDQMSEYQKHQRNKTLLGAQQIQNLDSRTQLLDKQVEYYLYSTFGSLAAGAAKSLWRMVSKTGGKTGGAALKGVKSMRGKKTNMRDWSKNKIFDQYPTTQF